MIERLAAPFPTHPIPCRLWSIPATKINRSRACGLPPRREGKTHGRGGSPIRLIGSRRAHAISDSQRSSPMNGTAQSRIFAALLLDAPPLPPVGLRALCAVRGDEILHVALAAAHRPGPPRCEGQLGNAPRLEPWISIIAPPTPMPPAPPHRRARDGLSLLIRCARWKSPPRSSGGDRLARRPR